MKQKYPYLLDIPFLKTINKIRIKEQYTKIIVLDFQEKKVKEIQGQISSGSINLDGSSNVRRTCNITFLAKDEEGNVTNISNILSINKKVKVEIGIVNTTDSYTEYPILWFPLGTYIIINPSISHDSNGVSVSLQLKDKMSLLNGECGGVIPAAVNFDEVTTVDMQGNFVTEKPTIAQIIRELVHHFGGEQDGKIFINGLDTSVKQATEWIGANSIFLLEFFSPNKSLKSVKYTLDKDDLLLLRDSDTYTEFSLGEDIGYTLVDFVYPQELNVDAGTTVTSVLDTIKNQLGNFEYFYDIDGNFIFQEIKNYLNTSYTTTIFEELNNSIEPYLLDRTKGKTAYRFSDGEIITSYSNSPQFNMIKNDFVVWGARKNNDGKQFPIRYHLAIDNKPSIETTPPFEHAVVYQLKKDHLQRAKFPIDTYKKYSLRSLNKSIGILDTEKWYYFSNYDGSLGVAYYDYAQSQYVAISNVDSDYDFIYFDQTIVANDWRTILYLKGAQAEALGIETGYYYTELVDEWPKLYNIAAQKRRYYKSNDKERQVQWLGAWREEVISNPSGIDYFLDIIDGDAFLQKISIDAIGRRTKVIKEDQINCIFEPKIPDYILIAKGQDKTKEKRQYCIKKAYPYVQVNQDIFDGIIAGGLLNSAFNTIRNLLYEYTSYNESITINCLPMYWIEPNTRICVVDKISGIGGDYIIKTISIPLDISGTMTISANRTLEKI